MGPEFCEVSIIAFPNLPYVIALDVSETSINKKCPSSPYFRTILSINIWLTGMVGALRDNWLFCSENNLMSQPCSVAQELWFTFSQTESFPKKAEDRLEIYDLKNVNEASTISMRLS